jgi:formate dehydrogenase
MIRPSLMVTEAITAPAGECRPEWEILDDIARRMGLGGAYSNAAQRWLAKTLRLRIKPRQMADLLLRTGKAGDWFGLRRSGWSWKKLAERAPHGVVLHEDLPLRPIKGRLQHPDRKIHLADPKVMAEITRLEREGVDPDHPYRLIGLREVRSHNSWMHNSLKLMPDSRRLLLRIHPADADTLGLAEGDGARITSTAGEVVVPVTITDEMIQGTVALPHGWGHDGSWQRANAAGGATSNFLASSRPEDVEALSGSTVLNGIPVRIEPVTVRLSGAVPEAETVAR